ncbi:VanZ family protein [Streptomyces sp. NPDC021056]|uniref:VanZ family protein n=1 Tax=Streptomyces sp. NPDC021056 TaxID=3155012 RepID=UPI0033EE1D7F
MARTALRPRSAFRLRTGKTGTAKTGTAEPESAKSGTDPKKRAPKKRAPKKRAPKERTTKETTAPEEKRSFLALVRRFVAMVAAFAFMVAFAVVLARLTLEPSPASEALTHTNLHPGRSLRAYLDQPELRDAGKQIGGNLLLGIPFGVLVPVVAPQTRGVLRVLLLTAVVMLLVEFAQGAMITGRAFDIDDVILNTTGALIGYVLLGRRLSRAVHR